MKRSLAVLAGLAALAALLAVTGQLTSQKVYAGEHTGAANPLAPRWLPPDASHGAVSIGKMAGLTVLALAILGFIIRTWRAAGREPSPSGTCGQASISTEVAVTPSTA